MFKKFLILLILIPSICFSATFYAPKDMDSWGKWEHLIAQIKRSHDYNITVIWHGGGGYIEIADWIVKELKNIAGTRNLNIHATGYSISAHADVLCELSQYVTYDRSTKIIMHNVFNYRADGSKFYDDYTTTYYAKYCKNAGWLTQKDIDFIVQKRGRVTVRLYDLRKIYNKDWT